MIASLRAILLRLGTQDIARTNAAQASIRLGHRRRQRDDADAYLCEQIQHHPHPAKGQTTQTDNATDLNNRDQRSR